MTLVDQVVADTHAFIWYVQGSRRLSESARKALDAITDSGLPLVTYDRRLRTLSGSEVVW